MKTGFSTHLAAFLLVSILLTTLFKPASSEVLAPEAHPASTYDWFDDLAIGAPGKDIYLSPGLQTLSAGGSSVAFGDTSFLGLSDGEFWNQFITGSIDPQEEGDSFGYSLAGGDFNGDGRADLAVGIPNEDIGTANNAGSVQIFYGSGSSGLTITGNQFWNQGGAVDGAVETGDKFGQALAAGDFNRDGFTDLAVGVPLEAIGTLANAGCVNILYGSAAGITTGGNQLWYQGNSGVLDTAEEYDEFGLALATGDFNGDTYADLAIGAPTETLSGVVGAGVVHILFGSPSGLTATNNELWDQSDAGGAGEIETSDHFGQALVAGNFNGDQYDDLAIGVPYEDYEGATPVSDHGAVNVFYGTSGGLTATGYDRWDQGHSDISDTREYDDRFGSALAAGDFDGDGFEELAIGVPREDLDAPPIIDAGAANILIGSSSGLYASDSFMIHQSMGTLGDSEAGDQFGSALASGDFNADGFYDLAIGVPYELPPLTGAEGGEVDIFYGSNIVLDTPGGQDIFERNLGEGAYGGDYNHFGYSLAVLPGMPIQTYLPIVIK